MNPSSRSHASSRTSCSPAPPRSSGERCRTISFEPDSRPLVVLSFHTAAAEDLVEIEVDSGESRRYAR